MRDARWTEGLTVGAIVAAATGGALVVMGHRLGSVALPFDAEASLVLGRGAAVFDASALTTMLGVVVHVIAGLVIGVLYASGRWSEERASRRWLWSATLAAGALLLSIVLARVLGVGPATVLPAGDRIVLGAVITLALPLGMRFAFPVDGRSR